MTRTNLRLTASIITLLCAAACVSAPAATRDAPRGDLILRAAGAGDWQVTCEAETTRGRTVAAEITGRGVRTSDVIAVNDVLGGQCAYDSGAAALTLTLRERGLSCPFGAYEDSVCETVVGAGQSGSVRVAPE